MTSSSAIGQPPIRPPSEPPHKKGAAGPKDGATFNLRPLDSLFSDQGLLKKIIPGFIPRPQQLQMAKAVAASVKESKHLLVEAGTGVMRICSPHGFFKFNQDVRAELRNY